MTDIATPDHWDAYWERSRPPRPFGTRRPDRVLRDFIASQLRPRPGQRLVELGAGNSAYLAGLATAFGYRVAGLDYSAMGVRMAQRNLIAAGVDGEVLEGDLYDPPPDWVGAFDVVFTMGVVEHFQPTRDVIEACARYLAPNGRMLTVIPNMHGFTGAATRWLSRDVFNRHVALGPDQLAQGHFAAGLTVRCATYLVGFDGRVANPWASPHRWKRAIYKPTMFAASQLLWAIEDRVGGLHPNRITSPWVVVVAQASD